MLWSETVEDNVCHKNKLPQGCFPWLYITENNNKVFHITALHMEYHTLQKTYIKIHICNSAFPISKL
jgi:hypothetical protein